MHGPSPHEDQASGLRDMARARPVKVIAVTSGKGGVGKTTVSTNLSMSLAIEGSKVMLMDADLGLANVDVLMGLHPRYNLSHVLDGDCALEDIILEGPYGVQVVPAASGKKNMAELSSAEHAGLIHAFGELTHAVDVLVVDTAAGISGSVASFCQAAQQVVVVVCDEPASLTDAYALIKILSRDYQVQRFQVLTNKTRSAQEGRDLYLKIARVSDRFLDVGLEHFGNVPADEYLRKAVRLQTPVMQAYPGCRGTSAFRDLARKTQRWAPSGDSRGQVEFFAERLIGAGRSYGVAS